VYTFRSGRDVLYVKLLGKDSWSSWKEKNSENLEFFAKLLPIKDWNIGVDEAVKIVWDNCGIYNVEYSRPAILVVMLSTDKGGTLPLNDDPLHIIFRNSKFSWTAFIFGCSHREFGAYVEKHLSVFPLVCL